MPTRTKLMKTKWYPRPHQMENAWAYNMNTATLGTTIYPLIMYDEGLGTPSAYEANPEHASFVEANEPNCFPESKVDSLFCRLKMNLTVGAVGTDKLLAVNFAYMPIFLAFKEDYEAKDELSGLTIETILELAKESTDRQGYPLWTNVDMGTKVAAFLDLSANIPALTTDTNIEAVNFNVDDYYDTLNYSNIAGKLKNVQGGLKWRTLTQRHPQITIDIRLRPKVKAMNPYTFFGLLVHVPNADDIRQVPVSSETSAINHVHATIFTRYYEWQQDFNFKRV